MVQVQVKGKEWEKVEVNDMWRQESGSEQQGLEARQEPQKADQKQQNHLPHALASVQLLERPVGHPACQGVKWRWEASQGVC